MTPNTKETRARADVPRPKPVAPSKSRMSRKRRRRRNRRFAAAALIVALTLALIAVGLWLVFSAYPEWTQRHYPMDYEALVRRYAAENDIPPAYVASVILAESGYRPDAVSYADARGLMQLLPSTAEWVAGKLGENFREESLFDPETNIRYGSWYLGFLMARYGGDKRLSSSAYHAGQGNVDRWLADPEYSTDGQTLDVIPFDSTNAYVSRVLKYYEKYAKLYVEAD